MPSPKTGCQASSGPWEFALDLRILSTSCLFFEGGDLNPSGGYMLRCVLLKGCPNLIGPLSSVERCSLG